MPHALQPYSLACHQRKYVIERNMSLKDMSLKKICLSVILSLYILSLKLLVYSACFVF